MKYLYTLYYKADDKEEIFKDDLTQEQVDLFLNSLEPALESCLRVEKKKEVDRDDER